MDANGSVTLDFSGFEVVMGQWYAVFERWTAFHHIQGKTPLCPCSRLSRLSKILHLTPPKIPGPMASILRYVQTTVFQGQHIRLKIPIS